MRSISLKGALASRTAPESCSHAKQCKEFSSALNEAAQPIPVGQRFIVERSLPTTKLVSIFLFLFLKAMHVTTNANQLAIVNARAASEAWTLFLILHTSESLTISDPDTIMHMNIECN